MVHLAQLLLDLRGELLAVRALVRLGLGLGLGFGLGFGFGLGLGFNRGVRPHNWNDPEIYC